MKCVCRQTCWVRPDGTSKPRLFDEGVVWDFEKCPTHFEVIESTPEKPNIEVDFLSASEEELLSTKWKFEDAAAVIGEAYKVELKKGKKADIVAQILDARYRAVEGTDIKTQQTAK